MERFPGRRLFKHRRRSSTARRRRSPSARTIHNKRRNKMLKKRISVITRVTALFALSLFSLSECALGESNCKEAKGDAVVMAVGAGPASGPITNGGDLNGTFTDVFKGSGFPTPDPTTV